MSLKTRQKALSDIYSQLEEISSKIETIESEVDDLVGELSDKARDSEKGEALAAELEHLNEASRMMTDLLTEIDEVKGTN